MKALGGRNRAVRAFREAMAKAGLIRWDRLRPDMQAAVVTALVKTFENKDLVADWVLLLNRLRKGLALKRKIMVIAVTVGLEALGSFVSPDPARNP